MPKTDLKVGERVISDLEILQPDDLIFDSRTRPSVDQAIAMILGYQNGYQIPFAAVPLEHHKLIAEQNLFRALFGRDSLLSANLLGDRVPDLEFNVVKALGAVQGVKYENLSEEEPGRIPHEVRDQDDPRAMVLMENGHWRFPYYGSVDSTLIWLNALARISTKTPSALDYVLNGVPLWRRAISATEWVLRRLDTSSGFIESNRRNSFGIQNQVWKDSEDSYMHADGTLAYGDSTASIETVGETFDALLSAGKIQRMRPNGVWPISSESLTGMAYRLQRKLIDLLWLGDRFALGTERLPSGLQVAFDSQASNQGRLLDSSILDDPEMGDYRDAIAEAVCDPQLLGESGLRTLSNKHPSYRPGGYHTGSAWPMDAIFTARGLIKHGYHRESLSLVSKTRKTIESIGGYPEFFRGDAPENGLITTHVIDVVRGQFESTNESNRVCQPPQIIQGWTVAAYAWVIDNMGNMPKE